MANLALIYGMRLLPADDLSELSDATVKLKSGREVRVTMHMLEGSKEEIVQQLNQSVAAFFDLFYGEG